MKTSKTITSLELYELILKKNNEILVENEFNSEIVINGYTIEDKYIIFDENIKIKNNIKFYDCTFSCKNGLFLEGFICKLNMKFEFCNFNGGFFIRNCNFEKDLSLVNVDLPIITINQFSAFNSININGNNKIKDIKFGGASFKSIHIGDYSTENLIDNINLSTKKGKTGKVLIQNQSLENLFITGTNDNKEFVFENIKCDVFNIDQFRNEGNLVFYGIEPLNPKNEESFFQIINSNLKNAQFHNVQFNKYKELVILDSFIQNCIFIGCKWSNNIRALFGKGFYHYEDSLLNGRAISEIEIIRIKDAYRQLKISMSNQSDKIQERKFYAEELNFHNRSLKWSHPWKNQFWDKLILYFSKYFSDYGQSFIIPLFWLLFGHFILFNTAVLCNSIESLQFSFVECSYDGIKLAFEKYFIYLNPLRSSETTLNGYSIILDLLMRIWSSYMLYNIIRASRRFLSEEFLV